MTRTVKARKSPAQYPIIPRKLESAAYNLCCPATDNTVTLLDYHLDSQLRRMRLRNLHNSSDHREHVSGNNHERWNKNLDFQANRVYRWDIGSCHAQAEQHHEKLAKPANRGEHRFDKSTDIAISVAGIPLRNRRGRYCCCCAEALESDLYAVRGGCKSI